MCNNNSNVAKKNMYDIMTVCHHTFDKYSTMKQLCAYVRMLYNNA